MYNYNLTMFLATLNKRITALNTYKEINENDKNELCEIVESMLFYKRLFTYDSINGHNYELEISKNELTQEEIDLFLTQELVQIICNELVQTHILMKKGE